MGFLGFANVYAMRVNLSVAIVAMVKNGSTIDNHTGDSDCPVPQITNTTIPMVSTIQCKISQIKIFIFVLHLKYKSINQRF